MTLSNSVIIRVCHDGNIIIVQNSLFRPGSQSVGMIEKAGAGRARSGKKRDLVKKTVFLLDLARPAPVFSIVPTD